MKLDETMEMAYPRKYVEKIIIGLEDPLNEHLVKLIGFDFPAEHSRTGSFKFYYDLLFDYPFGGVELQNTRTMMDLIGEEYGLHPTKSPQELAEWLQQFHATLAERLHQGQTVLDLVPD
jgi:NADH:ubiquinone oxidoreductase subunit C